MPEAGIGLSASGVVLAELGDAELLGLARSGSRDAFAVLFGRYSYAAQRLARHLGAGEDAEDVVAESFAQVWDLLCRGKGPVTAFRAYVFTTVRHEAGRRAKARQKVMPTDDETRIDSTVPFGGGELDGFERSVIRAAYESLPARWRTVLWHVDVEGRRPQELGPLLGLSANGVSALVYRARAGLREAYVQQHVNADAEATGRSCGDVRSRLAGFVRRTVSVREQERVHAHLESCAECMAVYLDLEETNTQVGHIASSAALVVSLVGAAVAALAGTGWSAMAGQLVVAVKGAVLALTPPAVAATVATATLVTVTSATDQVADSPSHAMSGVVHVGGAPQVTTGRVPSVTPRPPATGSRSGVPAARTDRSTEASPDRSPTTAAAAPPMPAEEPAEQPYGDDDPAGATVEVTPPTAIDPVGVLDGVVDEVAGGLGALTG